MCLALPMRIVAVDGALATIVAEGLEQQASLTLVPEARVGDFVLVHAGYALSVIDETEARETYELLREIGALDDAAADGPASADDGAPPDDAPPRDDRR